MSGLLPHNPNNQTGSSSSGSFITLTVGSLIVTSFASVANLAVSGVTMLANLTVSGTTTFTNLVVSGSATINGALNGVAGVFSDVYSNYTAGSTVTLSTTGSNANVLLSPNGTGNVVVKAGSGLTANSISPTTAGALSLATSSNGNLNISPGAGVVNVSCASFHPITVNNTSATSGSDILFQNTGVNVAGFGANQSTNEVYAWAFAAQPLKFGTSNTERLRIAAAGIANDNTATNILALQGVGTTLVTKTNVADTSSAQVFTNKTLDSASNTLTITNAPLAAANVNTLINQDVRTTASPTFAGATLTGLAAGATFDIITKNGNVLQRRIDITDQQLLTTSSPTFVGATLTGLAAGATFDIITKNGNVLQRRIDITNQQLLTTSSPTFTAITAANATLTGLAAGATFDILTKNGSTVQSRMDITNQQLLTTSGPTFATANVGTTLTVGSTGTGRINYSVAGALTAYEIPVQGTLVGATSVVLFSAPVPLERSVFIGFTGSAKGSAVPSQGYGTYQRDFKAYNNAGIVTQSNGMINNKSETNVAGGFTNNVAIVSIGAGANVQISISNSMAGLTVQYGGIVTVYTN